jgi:uncharacterized protein YggE
MKYASVVTLILSSVPLLAQALPDRPRIPTVRAHGSATVTAKPDQARIEIGVITKSATAKEAAAENAKQSDAVIAAIKKTAGAMAEIRTTNYSVHPNYYHPREGGEPKITGYIANNTVEVKVNDLEIVSKVIDAGTQAGANNIHGVQFQLKDEQSVRAEALRKAAVQARESAQAMAAALGLKVVRVLQVEDSEPVHVMPVRMMEMAAQKSDVARATPIEPGTIQVRATVSVTAEVSP